MASKKTKRAQEAGPAVSRPRGPDTVAERLKGKRGPPPRLAVPYTRALYRFREDQLEKLRSGAVAMTRRGAIDISALLRFLVDEWIAKGCPLPKDGGSGGARR